MVVLQSSLACWPPERRSDRPLLAFAGSLTAFALCFAWIYYSGIGGFALCRWDYVKHNLLFSYLLEQKLPIYSSIDNHPFILHYSLAYYITPVRLYQTLNLLIPGLSLNYVLVSLYSIVLFSAVNLLARRNPVFLLTLLAVCLVGGLDVLGMVAFGVKPDRVLSTPWGDISISYNVDWWGVPFAPQSLTTNLYYAPQHFFAALIGTALLYATLRCNRPAALTFLNVVLLIAASVFWSPMWLLVSQCLVSSWH